MCDPLFYGDAPGVRSGGGPSIVTLEKESFSLRENPQKLRVTITGRPPSGTAKNYGSRPPPPPRPKSPRMSGRPPDTNPWSPPLLDPIAKWTSKPTLSTHTPNKLGVPIHPKFFWGEISPQLFTPSFFGRHTKQVHEKFGVVQVALNVVSP